MALPIRFCFIWVKRYVFTYVCLAVFCGFILGFALIRWTDLGYRFDCFDGIVANKSTHKATTLQTPVYLSPERLQKVMEEKRNNLVSREIGNQTDLKSRWLQERIEKINRKAQKMEQVHVEVTRNIDSNYNVHIFYYAWYESQEVDGHWTHWNHQYIANWKKEDKKIYHTGSHLPPEDIGSNFYPSLGCYSSKDPRTIHAHMTMLKDAGVGVLVVSWYPPGLSDGAGESSDVVFLQLLDAAAKYDLKVAPHIEPYKNRNPINLYSHLRYFTAHYGAHTALYKMRRRGQLLPVYYIYDSYLTPAVAWRELLGATGNLSVRGTSEDGIFLGLLVELQHRYDIKKARFDGFYTYFATNGFTYGSSWKNWKSLGKFAHQHGLLFVPSIGPGYMDTRVRPWNTANTRHRRHGKYYEVGWRSALNSGASVVTITSFNEWHEGTQIEPAISRTTPNFTYLDYEPEGPDFYLNLTKWWVNEMNTKAAP